MFSVPRLVKRGALVGAIVALVVAAAALSPRRAEAQWGYGCYLQPVTTWQLVATWGGFAQVPVTSWRTICPSTFIGTPIFSGGVIASALTFNPFFRACPVHFCTFGNVASVHFQTAGHRFDPCRFQHCRPQHRVDPCHSCPKH